MFDFDLEKSNANKQKHGIDFVEAQELWLDDNLLQVPARTLDEPRIMVIGKIQDKHWSAILPTETNVFASFQFGAPAARRYSFMKTQESDQKFDAGDEEITSALDLKQAIRVNQQQKRVNVDFPVWMIDSLDKEAKRLGVSRQSIIKVWLAERLQQQKA